ncbi:MULTISPECIES: virulence factor SrfB [unclassified Empedobacter]|uniref:virulence factor SrfB n=1 Tax=unclassified Empedobacter TaxID=2643773 RepID=UPI0025C64075|nr:MULTISPECIES: virulence factor SrfB [unclassified Empedobacter]
MLRISLIANSSIQYHKFSGNIDLDFGKDNKLFFHQPFDNNLLDFIYDPLFKVKTDNEDLFYRKNELIEKDYIINNKLKSDSNLEDCKTFTEYYELSNLKKVLKHFNNKWIPLPFFKDNSINKDLTYPTDWVRLFITCNEDYSKAEFVLAIDTSLAKNEYDKTSPQLSFNPEENIYKLKFEESLISNFLYNDDSQTKWLEGYIADVFYGNNEDLRFEQPVKQYISHYLLLLKWLSRLMDLPEIQLFTDDTKKIPVDLVIDVGNSSTCALLFENNNNENIQFDKVKKLIIQDYTQPHIEYDKPFPMNLIFKESNFGEINKEKYHNNKFVIPSFVRIGFEADDLINKKGINLDLGYELKTYNSSPKRYLWDNNPSNIEWEFSPDYTNRIKKVYLNGISEQLNADGSLTKQGEIFGSKSLFSRNSLMKFVFLEMLIHAYIQINSFHFRQEHGNLTIPRTLRRITISCPTAMIQYEQVALRQAAVDACKLLNNYVKFYFDSDENKFWFEMPEIIPSIEDIKKKNTELEDRKDWMYDEATSCQLVFLYSLISKKLNSNQYVISNFIYKNKPNLTIGSIDIGAGTTDIMIADYLLNQENKTIELEPKPKYWDSFKIAGDDLLKEIIQQVIIEGKINSPIDEGCTGVIENYAINNGINNVSDKLNGFFGVDSNKVGYLGKMMRKGFIHQVAIPIAMYYLNNSNKNEVEVKTFEEIIGKSFTNKDLISYFERHFGFSFLDIKFTIQPKKLDQIIASVFDGLVKQLALVLNHYNCDYIVLSGKPASLNSLENLFLKYLSISPNNLINLNTYWIGKWFPFSDHKGYVEDAKTMVTVGAMISLTSNRLKNLEDLKLNIETLRKEVISTADYILRKDFDSTEIILTPKKNENTILIENLPFQFGYSKYESKNYPISNLYSISINEAYISQRAEGKEEEINKIKAKIFEKLPLKITISREYDESKENIFLESIENNEGDDLPIKLFKLTPQTLGTEDGYWLDTCEFTLGIRSN